MPSFAFPTAREIAVVRKSVDLSSADGSATRRGARACKLPPLPAPDRELETIAALLLGFVYYGGLNTRSLGRKHAIKNILVACIFEMCICSFPLP